MMYISSSAERWWKYLSSSSPIHCTNQSCQGKWHQLQLIPWVKLLKAQNNENQARVQRPTRPRWGAGKKPPWMKTDFSIFFFFFYSKYSCTPGNCEADMRTVTRGARKDPNRKYFVVWKLAWNAFSQKLYQKSNNSGLSGKEGGRGRNFFTRISFFGGFQKVELCNEAEKEQLFIWRRGVGGIFFKTRISLFDGFQKAELCH